MKKIFIDKLPTNTRKAINGYIQVIDWRNSIGKKVKFVYDDIEGIFEIIDYKAPYLFLKYGISESYKISASNFKKCQLGVLLNKKTQNFKIEIGNVFIDNKRNIEIINREIRIRNRKDRTHEKQKWYQYKCNICGFSGNESWIEESNLLKHRVGCACCNGNIICLGINTIYDKQKWMVEYVGEKIAKTHLPNSRDKITPVCPECGKIKEKMMPINSIYKNHSIGCSCGDGFSYPEKFVLSILSQLDICFITQLNKSTLCWCNKYKYDFYFEYDSKECILETHGEQHYKEISRGKSLKEEQENDVFKEQLAKENGIEHYIVIDCSYSEAEWIKNSILNSKLAELFDLNKIDWAKCEGFALNNLVKVACEYKSRDMSLTTVDIGEIMNLNYNTVSRYLKKGTKLGWCNYNAKEELKLARIKANYTSSKNQSRKVKVYKEGCFIKEFNSINELEKQSEIMFGIRFFQSAISKVINGKQKQHKGYIFE